MFIAALDSRDDRQAERRADADPAVADDASREAALRVYLDQMSDSLLATWAAARPRR